MEESKLELEKLILENELNKETITKLIQMITDFMNNLSFEVTTNKDCKKSFELLDSSFKSLSEYYKKVIDSIVEE